MNRQKQRLLVVALVLIIGAGGLLSWLKAHQKLGSPGLRLDLPERVLNYESDGPDKITEEEKQALPKDTSFSRRLYQAVENGQTNRIQLGIVMMGTDRTSIHKPQFCLTGQGWTIEKTEVAELSITRPHAYHLPVMKLTTAPKQVSAPDGSINLVRGFYIYWFVADKAITPNHWQRMWWMAKSLFLTGTLQRWAYVSCFAVCAPGQEEAAYGKIQKFLSEAVPQFQLATLPPTAMASAAK